MARTVRITETPDQLAQDAVDLFVADGKTAIEARGSFTVLLSGGTTMKAILRVLSQRRDVPWERVQFFWGDDRFVDRENSYSSFRLAQETLFSNVKAIRAANIHPVPVEAPDPVSGARDYDRLIRSFFRLRTGEWPRFDLALNGMGPDGHTASLFPLHKTLDETREIAVMSHAGHKPWVDRVTLTLPVFNHARRVLFTVTGPGKTEMLRSVIDGPVDPRLRPASAIDPPEGEALWLIDRSTGFS